MAKQKKLIRQSKIESAVLDIMQGPLNASAHEITDAVLALFYRGAWHEGATAQVKRVHMEKDALTLDRAAYRRKWGCVAEPPKARAAKAGQ